MMTTIEALLAEINRNGHLVTEAYQRDHDQWFAALRRRGEFTAAHGEGATMADALAAAWADAKTNKRMTNADWQAYQAKPKPSVPRFIPPSVVDADKFSKKLRR